MKDWLVCPIGQSDYWLTRVEVLADGRHDYLCGCCDGPLTDHVVAFFASSRDIPGSVASAICGQCDQSLGERPPAKLDAAIELLLSEGQVQ